MSTAYIPPEVFEQAKRNAEAARREAMRKLVDDLWRIMTTPLGAHPAAKPEAPVTPRPRAAS
jgi:hypothetical protein